MNLKKAGIHFSFILIAIAWYAEKKKHGHLCATVVDREGSK